MLLQRYCFIALLLYCFIVLVENNKPPGQVELTRVAHIESVDFRIYAGSIIRQLADT